jgi:hypothetical protein
VQLEARQLLWVLRQSRTEEQLLQWLFGEVGVSDVGPKKKLGNECAK